MIAILLILVGVAIGFANYYAMIYSLRRINEKNKQYYAPLSFLVRSVCILFLIWFFMAGSWKRALYLLLGFIIAKILVVYLVKKDYIKVIGFKI